MTYEEFKEKVGSVILTDEGNCPVTPNLIKISIPTQPPSGKDPEGGLANTRTRKEGMTKARSILREKRI